VANRQTDTDTQTTLRREAEVGVANRQTNRQTDTDTQTTLRREAEVGGDERVPVLGCVFVLQSKYDFLCVSQSSESAKRKAPSMM